jgi:hypothetical protein
MVPGEEIVTGAPVSDLTGSAGGLYVSADTSQPVGIPAVENPHGISAAGDTGLVIPVCLQPGITVTTTSVTVSGTGGIPVPTRPAYTAERVPTRPRLCRVQGCRLWALVALRRFRISRNRELRCHTLKGWLTAPPQVQSRRVDGVRDQ